MFCQVLVCVLVSRFCFCRDLNSADVYVVCVHAIGNNADSKAIYTWACLS